MRCPISTLHHHHHHRRRHHHHLHSHSHSQFFPGFVALLDVGSVLCSSSSSALGIISNAVTCRKQEYKKWFYSWNCRFGGQSLPILLVHHENWIYISNMQMGFDFPVFVECVLLFFKHSYVSTHTSKLCGFVIRCKYHIKNVGRWFQKKSIEYIGATSYPLHTRILLKPLFIKISFKFN